MTTLVTCAIIAALHQPMEMPLSSRALSIDEVEFLKGRIERHRLPTPDAKDVEKALSVVSISSATLENGLIARLVVNRGGYAEGIDLTLDPVIVQEMIRILKSSGVEMGWLNPKGEVNIATTKKS